MTQAGAAVVALALFVACGAARAQALPFLPPGDVRLRDTVQRLADEGTVPLATKWPISTLDLPPGLRDKVRSDRLPGSASDAGWEASAGVNATRLRTFNDTPRENGELGVHAGWAAGDYAGGAMRVVYNFDPDDDKHFRFDGTYAAARFGNWWLSAGAIDRWWGPGWDGSLILSTNARPLLGVSIDRASSRAPEWRWLRWVGPYSWTTFMGKFEHDRPDSDRALLWGLRLNLRPLNGPVELGFTRTAQWCRPGFCSLEAFKNVVFARDNVGENTTASEEPGNQLAGADFRWRMWDGAALYYQLNGESIDNNNWRPRLTTHVIGTEFWSQSSWFGAWRGFFEFADTLCGGVDVTENRRDVYACAYENGTFFGGYRTRGRVIGYPTDGDARSYSIGGYRVDGQDRTWEFRLRRVDLTRGGTSTTNTVSSVAGLLWNAELRVDGELRGYRYNAGVGVDWFNPRTDGDSSTRGRVFVGVSKPW